MNLSSRKNILWIVDHMGFGEVVHGAGNFYLNIIPEFDQNKFNIILCVLRGKTYLYQDLVDKGFKVYYLNKGKKDLSTIFPLLKIIKKEKIDLVHLSGYGSANFGRVVSILKKIPNIVHAYDEDMNYPKIQEISDKLLSRFTDQVVAVSEAVKKSCINTRSFPENKIKIINTGIPKEKFDKVSLEKIDKLKKEFNLKKDSTIVGSLSRLREEKGIKYIINAAGKLVKEFPDLYFFISGDGPLLKDLKAQISDLNIDRNVILAGFCEEAKVVLAMSDIYISASLSEGFSTSIQEAMALKRPIIATQVGGTPEMIEDNVTGLLVEPKNENQLSESIKSLLLDESLRIDLGMRAFESSNKWRTDILVKEFETLYSDMLS